MVQLDVELQELWVAHRGEVDASVARIEDAVSDLMAGALDDAGRDAARRAAQQLAGTVGTFGFTDASEHARVLGVVPKDVVQPRCGRSVAEGAVWTSVVVVVEPGLQLRGALC